VKDLCISIDGHRFPAQFEREIAPRTVAAFEPFLPFEHLIVHVRWSGEAMWAPLGSLDFEVAPEAATSYPSPGDMLLYPGGLSETELILAYGPTRFASRAGQLAGNPLLKITDDLNILAEIGQRALWSGSRAMRIVRV
jgi:hypothetical protein